MKIKSVKLLKDLPGCKAGEIITGEHSEYYLGKLYTKKFIESFPDFFEITYEQDETVHILLDVEVRKKYYDDITTFPELIKDFYNRHSSDSDPIISVKEVTNLEAFYKLNLEKL